MTAATHQLGRGQELGGGGLSTVAGTTSELLVFRVGGERFAMSVDAVEAVHVMPAITPLPAMSPDQLGVCDLRGALVPVYSPAAALNVALGSPAIGIIAWAGQTGASPGRRVAIAVDDVAGVTAVHERGWGDVGGAPSTGGFVRGVSASGAELTTLLHASAFLLACTGCGDGKAEVAS